MFAILDSEGNDLKSDCYSDCNGRLTSTCGEESTSELAECLPYVEVSLVAAQLPTRVFGTRRTAAKKGLATFTDLGIDSGVDSTSSCMCGEESHYRSCTMCHCDAYRQCQPGRCLPPAPFPNYLLRASLQGSGNLPLDVPVTLERRVFALEIAQQPIDSVAKEVFAGEIEVKASSCSGEIISSVGAMISVSLDSSYPPGLLSGTFPVRLDAGSALFTDLRISKGGADYKLILSWLGINAIDDKQTASFYVAPALHSILLTSSPSNVIETAGQAFRFQPKVKSSVYA